MEESILLSSDSNPSSPTLVIPDSDFDFPKVKLSEICGYPESRPSPGVFAEVAAKASVNAVPTSSNQHANSSQEPLYGGPSKKDFAADFEPQPSTSEYGLPPVIHELSDSNSDGSVAVLVMSDPDRFDNDLSEPLGSVMGASITSPPSHEEKPAIDSFSCTDRSSIRKPKRAAEHALSDSEGDEDSDATVIVAPQSPDEPSLLDADTVPFPSPGSASTQPFPSTDSSATIPPNNWEEEEMSGILESRSEPILSSTFTISEFISQLVPNSQPLVSNASSQSSVSRKGTKNSANALSILEKKRLKEMKIKEKAERAAVAESLRRIRPGECMKYVTVLLDQSIMTEHPWGPAFIEILQQSDIKHQVQVASEPCAVKWAREQSGDAAPLEENHILFMWSIHKLLASIKFGTLIDTFADFKNKYNTYKLYLAVYGLHNYYRKLHRAKQRNNQRSGEAPPPQKRKTTYDITENQIELELIGLQVKFGISHKALNSPQDTAYFLQTITKSIAELPYKIEREKVEMERNWYAKGDSKKCVRIDKDFNGLKQLWLQQLSQFNNSSLDTAKAVAQLYPTPLSLYNAYNQCSTSREKQLLLQDIVVLRGPGGIGRRLGPELSKKISILFCQDEDLTLS